MWQSSLFSYFRKSPELPQFSNHQPDQSAALSVEAKTLDQQKDYDWPRAQMMVSSF